MLDFIWHGPLKTVSDGWQISHSQMASRFQKMICYIQVQKTDYSQYNSEDFRVSHLFPLKSLFILYLPAVMLMFILLPRFGGAFRRYITMLNSLRPQLSGFILQKLVSGHHITGLLKHSFCSCLCISSQLNLCCCIEKGFFFFGFLYVFPENFIQNQMQMLLSSEGGGTPQNQLTLKHLLSM